MAHKSAGYLVAVLTLASCASYTSMPAPIPKAGDMPAWRTEGPVAVGADPYVELDRQAAVFNANFNTAGILAVHILVKNVGAARLQINRPDIRLTLPDASQVPPALKTAVWERVRLRGSTALNLQPVLTPGTLAYAGAGLAMIPGAVAEAQDAESRVEDYRRKEFKDVVLPKGMSAHGFVYFILPPGTQPLAEVTLTVPVVDIHKAERFLIRLPLTGLGFEGAEEMGK